MANKKKNKKKKVLSIETSSEVRQEMIGAGYINEPPTLNFPELRTVTVVAETVEWYNKGKKKFHKMEAGRMAAQVGHAVSKLKLSYLLSHYSEQRSFYTFAETLMSTPVTSIVLKARDENELLHIYELCINKGLPIVCFHDSNEYVYGEHITVMTAVSIGLVEAVDLIGITDYLPLWKEPNEL